MQNTLKHRWSQRATIGREQDAAKAPVGDAERKMLEDFRATPILETILTPTGEVACKVTRDVEHKREARIAYITRRLGHQKSHAREGFKRSQ